MRRTCSRASTAASRAFCRRCWSSPMPRLRAGILGVGGIAGRHAGALARLADRYELVAACGRRAEAAAAFTQAHGGTPFTDFGRMLDEAAPDVLIVALPPYAHGGEVEAAAARGVH